MKTVANHSDFKLKLNLQFFADNEEAILPNDFNAEQDAGAEENETSDEQEFDGFDSEETGSEEEDIGEETTDEETDDVTSSEGEQQPSTIKVKFNKEERDIPLDEAQALVQKGLNYDKQMERLKQLESDPRLSFVESLAKQNGMDVNDFIDHFNRAQEEAQLNELIQQNIPEELAREIMKNKKFRDQFEAERKQKEQEEKENADYIEFFKTYKDLNGKDFNAETDQLPPEVLESVQQGTSLKYAYMEHHVKQLQSQISILKQNQSNKKKAPVGSVTAHGSKDEVSDDPFLKGFDS